MAGIAGIGSGLTNIDDLVKTAVAAEKAPKQNQLDKVEKNATTQITALGSLKSAVSEFQTALTTLNSPSSFLAKLAEDLLKLAERMDDVRSLMLNEKA